MTTVLASEIVAVYAVFGSDEEARLIAREMVEARLAACANILGPCRSFYRWQGAVEEATEVACIFKTRFEAAERLLAAIDLRHSYDTPAAVVLPIAAVGADYLQWVLDNSD